VLHPGNGSDVLHEGVQTDSGPKGPKP
jgi:hypothetical protein